MEDFVYIVNPPKIPKVVFGSGQPRITMRLTEPEQRIFPGPADYAKSKGLVKKHPSKFGYSMFQTKITPKYKKIPSCSPAVGDHELIPPRKFVQLKVPFGIGIKLNKEETFLTPGYSLRDKVRIPLMISTAFGSKRVTWPAVAIFCNPFNTSKCDICGRRPVGDYWHNYNTAQDKCRQCMTEKIAQLKSCKTDSAIRIKGFGILSDYKRVRSCEFFHNHNGTKAAMQLIPKKYLKMKIRAENYLYTFKR